MPRMVHNSAVELASPLFRRKRKRGNTGSRSAVGLQPFSIIKRRYSAGSSRLFSPFFSDRFERRGLVYVGSSIQHKTAADAVFAEYGFTWDAGNRITEFETVDGTAEYTYDKTGQLTGADYDYITDELYTYDSNGNRTNAGYVTGDNNETLSDGVYRYSYDNEGNRTEKFLWADTNNDGIIDASEKTLVQTYEWDYRNRLSSVTNYENGIAKEVMDYLYDYLNLMIERTVTDAATSILQSSEYNLYSNGQVVLEYDTTSSVDVVKSVNLWGANIDELVAVEQMAQSVNDNNVILWAYGDHLNSIRDIVLYDSITQTAAVVNYLIYNAFGILVSSTDGSANPASISPLLNYRYTGKFFDDFTGLQNNINRWYDNTTGKWISVDPIGFKGGDVNLYRYAGGSLKRDINGLFTMEDFETVYQMSYDEFLSIFCSVHKNDPDLEKMIAFYKYEIYPRNEVRNQIDEKLKSLSENLYYSIINGIKEKERLRSRFQQLFLNNSFNESSNIVNSPYLRNGNTQVGVGLNQYGFNNQPKIYEDIEGGNFNNSSPFQKYYNRDLSEIQNDDFWFFEVQRFRYLYMQNPLYGNSEVKLDEILNNPSNSQFYSLSQMNSINWIRESYYRTDSCNQQCNQYTTYNSHRDSYLFENYVANLPVVKQMIYDSQKNSSSLFDIDKYTTYNINANNTVRLGLNKGVTTTWYMNYSDIVGSFTFQWEPAYSLPFYNNQWSIGIKGDYYYRSSYPPLFEIIQRIFQHIIPSN